jgi:alpha-tubulin suppressor-like RCC1 family protein
VLSHLADALEPVEVKMLQSLDIAAVVCGHFHSFARSVEGSLYAWGKNCNGQLGIGTGSQRETSPKLLLLTTAACAHADMLY